jgi:hypothetical protein
VFLHCIDVLVLFFASYPTSYCDLAVGSWGVFFFLFFEHCSPRLHVLGRETFFVSIRAFRFP